MSTTDITHEEAHSALTEALEALGKEEVHAHLLGYSERSARIATLNETLAHIDPASSETQYNDTVAQILEATNDYYAFMGKLPEPVRRLLASLGGLDDDGLALLREVGDLTDDDIPLPEQRTLSMQSIRPQRYIMQLDAITNQLATLSGQTSIRVGKQRGEPVRTTVTLDMPDHMKIEGGGALTTYDKSILNGVTSLIESGNTVFSVPMLYHAMTGKKNPTVDEALADELAGKLEKMRRMMVTIDLSEENKARFIRDEHGDAIEVRDVQLEGYLMPLNRVSGYINGRRAELYQILQHPPLYSYAKMKRQLATVPIDLLGAPVNNNSTTIPLKTYLLQRIEMMKNQKNNIHSNIIKYETIYRELGAEDGGKTKKMRIRTYTETILQYFVDSGYIKNFSTQKTGRSISGIIIEL